ncbi:MAG: 8-oxo-dGTP diphosphatase [Clostridiales bacterium]|jgi:8-oxo-dGTP diphosphatase|nr:8-oxo-dGTP diphosphatase [Clostridiales bacterium]MDN5282157.1 8-oxo-dGTP diphosphatase [Candidatus Ozemobacter sp.]
MTYTYEFPRPSVTLDAVVLRTPALKFPEILLIKRGREPFAGSWALPGGFLEMEESPLFGAARELLEETGLSELPLKPLFTCGEPGRDPRGRTITMLFGCLVRDVEQAPKGSDDADEAAWFSFDHLPELAFDHKRVINQVKNHLQWQTQTSIIGRDVFHGVASKKDIIRLHQNICSELDVDLVERAEKLGLLTCKEGICQYLPIVPHGPDWHPNVW